MIVPRNRDKNLLMHIIIVLPVAKAIFDIGDDADESNAEQRQENDGDKRRRHIERVGLEINKITEPFRRHEKLRDDDTNDGAPNAGSQPGQNIGHGRRQRDRDEHL